MTDVSVSNADVKRGPGGRFLPGHAIKGPGRPKGSPDFVSELLAAMRKVEKAKRKPIFEHAWSMAYDDPKLMAALFRKILPDLQHQTGDVPTQVTVVRVDATPIRANGSHGP